METLISPETYTSIKSLSKDYKITSNSSNPKKNKHLMRYQISEMLRKIQPKEDLETYENIKS